MVLKDVLLRQLLTKFEERKATNDKIAKQCEEDEEREFYEAVGGAYGNAADDLKTILDHEPNNDNTGLPCEFCGQKLKRLQIERSENGTLFVRVSVEWSMAEALSEAKGFLKLVGMFVKGS